jgi:hypothetical protein
LHSDDAIEIDPLPPGQEWAASMGTPESGRLPNGYDAASREILDSHLIRRELPLKSQEPFSDDHTLHLVPGQGMVHVFCEHLSPADESACNPKTEKLAQSRKRSL